METQIVGALRDKLIEGEYKTALCGYCGREVCSIVEWDEEFADSARAFHARDCLWLMSKGEAERLPVVDPLAEYDVECTRARRGESCHSCKRSFNAGERILLVDDDFTFCSGDCAMRFYL